MNIMNIGTSPGPWVVVHDPVVDTRHIRVETDLDAAPVASLFYSTGGSCPYLRPELVDANSRLVAAAPDLYEALYILLVQAKPYEDGDGAAMYHAQNIARAALAKAQGLNG